MILGHTKQARMPAIHQSDLDKRKYRVVTLSNSLKAILIQGALTSHPLITRR